MGQAPLKVLIVEDEAMLRTAYQAVLEANGMAVALASDGVEGLDVLVEFLPDVILLDLLMPQLGGKGFLQEADIRTAYPNTKVIVYSNVSDQTITDEVLALGADQVILKSSMTPGQLVEAVVAQARA